MKKDLATAGVDLAEARSQIDKVRKSLAEGQHIIDARQVELQAVQRRIADETKKLKGFNDELDSLKEAVNGRKADIVEVELKTAQLDKEVDKAKKDAKDAADKVAKREAEFDWIADECQCVSCSRAHSPLPAVLTLVGPAGPSASPTRPTILPTRTCAASRTSAASSRRTTAP